MLLPLWQMELPQGQPFIVFYFICFYFSFYLVLFFILFIYLFYFILSSEMLNRISSHMWGRWCLPIFLFRDGLLTLMYIDSVISLMMFWSSLPTTLKISSVVVWPVVLKWLYMGEGALKVFFKPLSKCSCRLFYVFFITFHSCYICICI